MSYKLILPAVLVLGSLSMPAAVQAQQTSQKPGLFGALGEKWNQMWSGEKPATAQNKKKTTATPRAGSTAASKSAASADMPYDPMPAVTRAGSQQTGSTTGNVARPPYGNYQTSQPFYQRSTPSPASRPDPLSRPAVGAQAGSPSGGSVVYPMTNPSSGFTPKVSNDAMARPSAMSAAKLPDSPMTTGALPSGKLTDPTAPTAGAASPSDSPLASEQAPGSVVRDTRSLQEKLSAAWDNNDLKPATGEPTPALTGSAKPQLPVIRRGSTKPASPASPSAVSAPAALAETSAAPSEPRTAQLPPSILAAREAKPRTADTDSVLFTRQSPVLGVKTTGPRRIVIGQQAVYTITIFNSGDMAANDVIVGIKAPDWAEVVGTQPSTGTTRRPNAGEASDTLQWKISSLAARGQEKIDLRIVPRKGQPFDLAVEWKYSPVVSQAQVEVQEPKLMLAVAGPDEVLYGQKERYKLTLSNPGTGPAENVMIHLMPIGPGEDQGAQHPMGTLAAGDSKVVEVELTARQAGILFVKAQATADGGLTSDVAQKILVRRAGLQVDVQGPKTKYAGTLATYRIRVANPGNAPAENIQLGVVLPNGAKYVNSSDGGQYEAGRSKVVWTLPSLAAEKNQVLTLECILASAGPNRLHVVSAADGSLTDTVATTTQVQALADLVLSVTDPPGPIAIGEETTYEVHLQNRGTNSADNVEVVAYFSSGVEAVSAEGAPNEIGPGQVVFGPIASVSSKGEIVLRIKARADKPGNHIFRTEVSCKSLGSKLAHEETTLFYGDEVLADDASEPEAEREAVRVARRPSREPAELAPASNGTDAKASQPVRVSEKEPTLAPLDKDEAAAPIAADEQPSPLPAVESPTPAKEK